VIVRADRMLDLGVAALAAAQLGAAFVLSPGGDELGVTCPSRAWFGVACPCCGLSRSFVALAHGDVRAAFAAHPAGPLLALAMLALVATTVLTRRRFDRVFEVVVATCIVAGVFHTMRS
jgi:hypothetical protein